MVGDVCDRDNLGNARPQHRLDSLAHGHGRQAAALTTTLQAKADTSLVQGDQHDATTMGCNRRSDVLFQYLANPIGKFAGLIHLRPTGLHSRNADAGYLRER